MPKVIPIYKEKNPDFFTFTLNLFDSKSPRQKLERESLSRLPCYCCCRLYCHYYWCHCYCYCQPNYGWPWYWCLFSIVSYLPLNLNYFLIYVINLWLCTIIYSIMFPYRNIYWTWMAFLMYVMSCLSRILQPLSYLLYICHLSYLILVRITIFHPICTILYGKIPSNTITIFKI